jgi:hypothetical protein
MPKPSPIVLDDQGNKTNGFGGSASSLSAPGFPCHTFYQPHQYVSAGRMATEGPTALPQSSVVRRLRTSSGRGDCTWDGCQHISHTDEELRAHLEVHSHEALARWSKGFKCTWQGCKSKAVFKIPSLLKEHLRNIHATPLLCTQRGCPYKKPFRNRDDLNRHESTKHHSGPKWECPYDSCSAETRTFARKDKWLKHIRETQHENDAFCPYYHCNSEAVRSGKTFENRKEIGEHFSDDHAGINVDACECGLGSCGKTENRDRWNFWSLAEHLGSQHKIWEGQWSLKIKLKEANHIFSLQHVEMYYLDKWVDCDICASQLQAPLNISTPVGGTHGAASF